MNEDTRNWRCFFGMHLYDAFPVKKGEWSKGGIAYTSEKGEYQTLRCKFCGSLATFYQQTRFSEI